MSTATEARVVEAPGSFTGNHPEAVRRAGEWLSDGVNDVRTGVDDQMVAWSDWWPSDSCGTDSAAKDYASALMAEKCRRLGITFPVAVYVDPSRTVDWTRTWAAGTEITDGRSIPQGTILLMSGNPQTADGGRVYWDNTEPVYVEAYYGAVDVTAGANIRVKRVDGVLAGGMADQSVGARYLKSPGEVHYQPETAPEPAPVSEEDRLRARLREAEQRHHADIETIGERLIREARNRNWCSEYDEIVQSLNRSISVPLPERERDYEVVINGWVRVPFSYTVTVTASDEDSAIEMAQDGDYLPDGDDLIRDGYIDRYSAEVEDDLDFSTE